MKNQKIKLMCIAGVFTALVYVFTAYMNIKTYNGYVHIGDGFIYLTACLLPTPYGMFVGACGAFLADCLTGYIIWAPGSVIIKAAAVLLFSYKSKKIVNWRNSLALIPASAICIGGYYLYEALFIGSFVSALQGILGSVTQSVISIIVFIILGFSMDKLNIKQIINGGHQK